MRFASKLSVVMLLCAAAACGDDDPAPAPGGDGDEDGAAEDGNGDGNEDGNPDGNGDGTPDGNDPDGDNQPPEGEWTEATGNLAGMASECGNVSYISAKPDGTLIAGIALHGLWHSADGGDSWTQLGQGDGSEEIPNRASSIVYDPTDPDVFWESGIYGGGGGAYRTDDNGDTFIKLGETTHHDLISVDFSDAERKTLVVGGHEAPRMVRRSVDGGATWEDIPGNLPDNESCTYPMVIDADTYLLGCSYTGDGIYRTTNGGQTWTEVAAKGGANAPLRASDDSIYWAIKEGQGLMRSTDDGQTWTQVTEAGVLSPMSPSPIELPDGRIAAVGASTILASDDAGETWEPVSQPLPYADITGFVYSESERAFFVKRFSCDPETDVPANGIMRFDYDYEM